MLEQLVALQTDKREILECFFDGYIGEIGLKIGEVLEQIVIFISARCEEELNFKGIENLEGQDLLDQIIAYNQYLLLPKDFWDYVAQNIEDKKFV
ncbi:MAG: hypothetical protein ACRC1P_11140 [Cellulosilyticaceae bacterium]